MDLSILLIAGAGLLAGSVVLSVGIERLIRRFGVRPARPDERTRGFRDVLTRLDQWRRSRQASDR